MELLEREEALAALAEARDAAARGEGRVVFVTRRARDRQDLARHPVPATIWTRGARVLLGTCDDLSIPRPLGPIRDLVGSVSPALERRSRRGAAPHDIQTLLVAELELPPRPTVLVLEDVHWADDATFDAITVLGRRIGSLPALLVLTFRAGEAPPGHPLYATVGAVRADDSVVLELAPLSESAVASLVGDRADEVYAATGGNPFYVTELLGSAAVGRPAAVDHERRARTRVPARRRLAPPGGARLGRAEPRARVACWTRSCRTGPTAAVEPERRQLLEVGSAYVRFRHELARHAIRSSIPAAARRRLHAEILEALLADGRRPGGHRPPRGGGGRGGVVCDYALIAARRAAELESNREAYSLYRRAASFVDRLPAPEQATVLEELASAAYAVGRLEDAFAAIERAIAIYGELGDEEAVGRCTRVLSRYHWVAGDGDAARRAALEAVAILEPLGPSVELARAYSAVSQLEMLAEDVEPALAWGDAGARPRDAARRRADTRARARQHRQRQAQHGRKHRHAARGARRRGGSRRPARGGARARQPRPQPHVLGAAGRGAAVRAAGGRVRHRARAVHHRVVRRHGRRLAAAARRRLGRGRAPDATRDRERHGRPAARQDGAARAGRPARRSATPPSGWPRSAPRPIAPASRSGSCRSSSSPPSGR